MRPFAIVFALGAIVLSTAACSTGGGATPSPAAAGGTGGTLEGTQWRLSTFDKAGTPTQVPAGVVVDARFASGRVAGSSGCNVYSGPAPVTGASIKIGPVASTLMACAGPAAEVESDYLAALSKVASFTATSDSLTLYDAAGTPILVYAAGPANPLEGEWIVTGYNNGRQAVTSPIVGTTLTAVFTADAVSGSAGCNDYNGPYKLDGSKVTIGPLASTRKACEQAVMDQEQEFLTALQTPSTVEVSGATVTLRDASGATQVVLAPKP
jgi:heat shock protein HslJ